MTKYLTRSNFWGKVFRADSLRSPYLSWWRRYGGRSIRWLVTSAHKKQIGKGTHWTVRPQGHSWWPTFFSKAPHPKGPMALWELAGTIRRISHSNYNISVCPIPHRIIVISKWKMHISQQWVGDGAQKSSARTHKALVQFPANTQMTTHVKWWTIRSTNW